MIKMSEKKKIRCPRCRGLGEIMKREKSVDTDGSEDIGNTPYVSVCPKCLGEGEVDLGKPKFYKNSPKGRSEIPAEAGIYTLIRQGYGEVYIPNMYSNNLKRRIKEYHYDKNKNFSYIKITLLKKEKKVSKE